MTNQQNDFKSKLIMNRNKLKMLLGYYLDSVADSIIMDDEPLLPIQLRSGYLEYSKNSEKFEIFMETIVEVFSNLVKNQIRTKRDMYYGNSSLYKRQSVLDSSISTISKTFSVPRDALNVVGAAKGLYFGEISINDSPVNIKQLNLIPRREDITSMDLFDTKFILVIEKDAVMNTIIEYYDQMKQNLGSFLMISGKGFPCMRTKQFMNLLEYQYPNVRKYILVDNDPHGIDIALNYVTASENENDSCESIQYIGIDHYDIDKYGNHRTQESLNASDLRRLETIKLKASSLNRLKEIEEIKFMRNNLKKTEIESLYNPDCKTFCIKFLVQKLQGLAQMEAEDIALKKRLLIEEKIVRKLSKKLLNNDEFEMEKEQLAFQFEKNFVILKSFERDWNHIIELCQHLGKDELPEQNITKENETISNCKSDLIDAKQILQNRLEYDKIAKDILSLQSQPELNENISFVNNEIESLLKQIESVDHRTQERYTECSQVLESVQILLESVNADKKEFK